MCLLPPYFVEVKRVKLKNGGGGRRRGGSGYETHNNHVHVHQRALHNIILAKNKQRY